MKGFSRERVVIEDVKPLIDCGRFPVKRVTGQKIRVTANIFSDGHCALSAVLLWRHEKNKKFSKTPMKFVDNDLHEAEFTVKSEGRYFYTICGWVDEFETWARNLKRKKEAGEDISAELAEGAKMMETASAKARGADKKKMEGLIGALRNTKASDKAYETAVSSETALIMGRNPVKSGESRLEKELEAVVDRKKALFSTWYELFPRSCGTGGRHGTFKDCEKMLGDIAAMGFDVLYLPPIHPIGVKFRKGKNNSLKAGPSDPGSPWQIGSKEGGHKAVHPELGTVKDFENFVKKVKSAGMEVAVDFAIQCSQDHPYITEHPEWFKWRPDGSVQYAENPPKKYQDIVPVHFDAGDNRELWEEMKSILVFWIGKGVRIFRVDNPHTKPFKFWSWLLGGIKKEHPDVLFLSEAFTKPHVMHELAKCGFTQSYTYFTWRYDKAEYTRYLTEITKTEAGEFFRPNFWPNTPDILMGYLQANGRPEFIIRYVLAATLSSNCGIYGPAYELCENRALPGREEYLDSEKYEIKKWDLDRPGNIRNVITLVNRIRKENPALQETNNLDFCDVDNERVMAYIKKTQDNRNVILTVVNLDHANRQSGWVTIPLKKIGFDAGAEFRVRDLLGGAEYAWKGGRNFIQIDPWIMPAHIFKIIPK
ncbi:MAG: alpha-1,4-glucan--maltose-1-phosphate maltosyltransferase [Endomicrobiales bacterium]|nr:alpha-1,4-glucan--maltose-1-phosphate maltosyltransferase [Endomicrobiales bacterium]